MRRESSTVVVVAGEVREPVLAAVAQSPNIALVASAEDDGQAAAQVRQALRELPHGPWWPPLDELLATARTFFAGSLGGPAAQAAVSR